MDQDHALPLSSAAFSFNLENMSADRQTLHVWASWCGSTHAELGQKNHVFQHTITSLTVLPFKHESQ